MPRGGVLITLLMGARDTAFMLMFAGICGCLIGAAWGASFAALYNAPARDFYTRPI